MGIESYLFRIKKCENTKTTMGKFLDIGYLQNTEETLKRISSLGRIEIKINDHIFLRTSRLSPPDIVKEMFLDISCAMGENTQIYDFLLKKTFYPTEYEQSYQNFIVKQNEFLYLYNKRKPLTGKSE